MRFLVAALLLFSSTANAEEPAQRLDLGEKHYANQEYLSTIETLSTVVSDPIATRDQRARAYEYLGLSWLVLGKRQRARDAFEELLAIDPQYTLTDRSRSPKLRAFFEEVRATFVPGYRRRAVEETELEHSAPTGALAGRPLEISARAVRGAVAQVLLHARQKGMLGFSTVKLRAADDGSFRARFSPPSDAADYLLEYYLEGRDERGRVLARVASPERPIALPVRGSSQPWFKRWYVWTILGAVAVGVVIGASVGGTAERAPSGTLPPGKVNLGITF